jgi:hypothetical protein
MIALGDMKAVGEDGEVANSLSPRTLGTSLLRDIKVGIV